MILLDTNVVSEAMKPAPDDAKLLELAVFMTTSFEAGGAGPPDKGAPLDEAEALEATVVRSAAGQLHGMRRIPRPLSPLGHTTPVSKHSLHATAQA